MEDTQRELSRDTKLGTAGTAPSGNGPAQADRHFSKWVVRRALPIHAHSWLSARVRREPRPMMGWVRFGSLRRLTPISRDYGYDRGKPIDRYYIESFLACHADKVSITVRAVKPEITS